MCVSLCAEFRKFSKSRCKQWQNKWISFVYDEYCEQKTNDNVGWHKKWAKKGRDQTPVPCDLKLSLASSKHGKCVYILD